MFAATAVLMVLSGPVGEVAETTRSLELGLRVVEAFEHGPVILDVTLTNRGKKPLVLVEFPGNAARLYLPKAWNAEPRRPWECKGGGGAGRVLEVGETHSDRHIIHAEFRSEFPAGTHQVGVGWCLVHPIEGERLGRYGELAAYPTKSFPVTISPATPANRWALAARLEAEYAALPPPSPDEEFGSPFSQFCKKVSFSPHEELVPLLVRLLDRHPVRIELGYGPAPRSDLIETIFQADPATAHRVVVDRLVASPPRIDPFVGFMPWRKPAEEFASISRRLFAVFNPEFLVRPQRWSQWNPLRDLGDLIAWSRDAAARRLPDAELRRLAAAKNPEVRRYVEHYFGTRLGPK